MVKHMVWSTLVSTILICKLLVIVCQLPFLLQGSKSSYASMEKIVWLSLQHLNLYVCRNRFGVRDFNAATLALAIEIEFRINMTHRRWFTSSIVDISSTLKTSEV